MSGVSSTVMASEEGHEIYFSLPNEKEIPELRKKSDIPGVPNF